MRCCVSTGFAGAETRRPFRRSGTQHSLRVSRVLGLLRSLSAALPSVACRRTVTGGFRDRERDSALSALHDEFEHADRGRFRLGIPETAARVAAARQAVPGGGAKTGDSVSLERLPPFFRFALIGAAAAALNITV